MVKQVLKRLHEKLRKIGRSAGTSDDVKPAHASPQKFQAASAPRERTPREDVFRPGEKSPSGPRPHSARPPRRHPAPAPTHREPPRAAPPAPPWDPASFAVPVQEGKTRFHDLNLPPEILRAVADLDFQYCTPIQAEIMPKTLAGLDAAGKAQTGTGKTAAFLITILNHLLKNPSRGRRSGAPRALILAPTRELVMQIDKDARSLGKYCPFHILAVFGGMDYNRQKQQLETGSVDIIMATPGRLLDFKRHQNLHLNHVEILVIDEADRMLDMGFIPDVREIVHSTPPKARRQTMLFSATLTADVIRLASQWTRDAVRVEIEPEQVAASSVNQIVYITTVQDKFTLLYKILKKYPDQPVLIFGNRRDETQHLTEKLRAFGITCALLSGAVAQEKRIKTLEGFRSGRIRVLVATDVAGRGLHVEGISHVINYNLPVDPEDYVHRIGRTGRAGATGTSVSFACEEDSFYIPEIEKYLGNNLSCTYPDEELLTPPPPPAYEIAPSRREHRGPRPPFRGGPRRGGRPPPRRPRR